MRNPEKIDRKSSFTRVFVISIARLSSSSLLFSFVRSFVFRRFCNFRNVPNDLFILFFKCRGHYDSICFILLLPNTKISVSLWSRAAVAKHGQLSQPTKRLIQAYLRLVGFSDTLKRNLSIFLQSKQTEKHSLNIYIDRFVFWSQNLKHFIAKSFKKTLPNF